MVAFTCLYTLPKFFELRVTWEPNGTDGGGGEYRLTPTNLRKNKIYIRVYLICMNFVVQILIPFIVLIILNLLTYQTIKESEKNLIRNVRYIIHYTPGWLCPEATVTTIWKMAICKWGISKCPFFHVPNFRDCIKLIYDKKNYVNLLCQK